MLENVAMALAMWDLLEVEGGGAEKGGGLPEEGIGGLIKEDSCDLPKEDSGDLAPPKVSSSLE